MPLVTANQFQLQPDTGLALQRGMQLGQQFKQLQQQPRVNELTQMAAQGDKQALIELQGIAPERAAQVINTQGVQQQQKAQANEQRFRSIARGALEVQSIPTTEGKIASLTKRRNELIEQGVDTSDTDAAIDLYSTGRVDEANQLIDSVVTAGERQGFIKPKTFKSETLDIRKQEAELRAAEQKQKDLDRQVIRESNQLKRDELKLKAAENERRIEQGKKDREFTASSALSALDQGMATVELLLEGEALESAAGFQSNFPTIAGTEASGFEAQLDKLKSQTFLLQVEKMKGLGALGEKEGAKLESALAALSIKQPDKKLRSELSTVKNIMNNVKKKLQKKFGVAPEVDEAAILAKYGL